MKDITRFHKFLLVNPGADRGRIVGHVAIIGSQFWDVVRELESVSFDKKGNVIRAETENTVYVYVGETR